jgi:hypothetical protein
MALGGELGELAVQRRSRLRRFGAVRRVEIVGQRLHGAVEHVAGELGEPSRDAVPLRSCDRG